MLGLTLTQQYSSYIKAGKFVIRDRNTQNPMNAARQFGI